MSYLSAVLKNNCPSCRKGFLFKNKSIFPMKEMLEMHEKCPVCNQPTELEVGFYYGTGYLSYALSVAWFIAFGVFYYVVFGLSFKNNSIFTYLIVGILLLVLLQPWMMRMSRTLYLSFFVKYNPNFKN